MATGRKHMFRQCTDSDFEVIHEIINDAAHAYKGIIPAGCWKEPYMSKSELRREINNGVVFWGYEEEGRLEGVMGIQDVQGVTLIRHAYVRTASQNRGIGSKLLSYLRGLTEHPILIATWADAKWAVGFYEKNGFRMVPQEENYRLQRKYWSAPERQVRASVVFADRKWFDMQDSNR